MRLIIYNILFLLILFPSNFCFGQQSQGSWNLGFGITYPRFMSITRTSNSGDANYGGYLSLDRNFSEHISLRLKTGIYHIESFYSIGNSFNTQRVTTFTGDVDFIYSLYPYEQVSPMFIVGGGFVGSRSQNSLNEALNKFIAGYEINFGLGAYWDISELWKLKTEINYHTVSNNKLDGNLSLTEPNKGILRSNGDTYMTFEIGVIWRINNG